MLRYLPWLLFSFQGRAGRLGYLSAELFVTLFRGVGARGACWPRLVLAIGWLHLALQIKRLHDLHLSGGWVAL
jgi:uncharacterized membrane protein YhaH (DUF805 family)